MLLNGLHIYCDNKYLFNPCIMFVVFLCFVGNCTLVYYVINSVLRFLSFFFKSFSRFYISTRNKFCCYFQIYQQFCGFFASRNVHYNSTNYKINAWARNFRCEFGSFCKCFRLFRRFKYTTTELIFPSNIYDFFFQIESLLWSWMICARMIWIKYPVIKYSAIYCVRF